MPRVLLVTLLVSLLLPQPADAFCGFYVSGAGAKLFNNASQVVMMRDGIRTVLSMQNNYQGPPSDFAMVVPVPVVLQKEQVKTLSREVFERIDRLTAPRLVEYWEQDPCRTYDRYPRPRRAMKSGRAKHKSSSQELGVTVEAQFVVGEYEVVILSARDSTGLDTWLRQEGYKIPGGAERYLRPYVQAGTKFFVAKVDVSKVKFVRGQAMLSPLRFHYDSQEFSLPVRLGLMNSHGTQDLIVHILARNQRYDVANYPNVTIPTNIDVAEEARSRFGAFYAALFDRTLRRNPGAVITEYAWDAGTCDPCPTPPLGYRDLASLGADVVGPGSPGGPSPIFGKGRRRRRWRPRFRSGFVLTRLHARYRRDGLGQDLVFRAAPPIGGGREVRGPDGELEESSHPANINNFQARYAIRHPWRGPVACANPRWGRWGGPPGTPRWRWNARPSVRPAMKLAFAPRGRTQLARLVRRDVPEIGLRSRRHRPRSFWRPVGTWPSTFGELRFGEEEEEKIATYPDQGRLLGKRKGRRFTGVWAERSSKRRCATARDGSHYWGKAVFQFDRRFTRFQGRWGYCDARPTRTWRGHKR